MVVVLDVELLSDDLPDRRLRPPLLCALTETEGGKIISSASLSLALPSLVSDKIPNPRTVSDVDAVAIIPIDISSRLSLFLDLVDLLLILFECCSESLAVGSGAPKSSERTLNAETEPAFELDGDTGLRTIGVPVSVV